MHGRFIHPDTGRTLTQGHVVMSPDGRSGTLAGDLSGWAIDPEDLLLLQTDVGQRIRVRFTGLVPSDGRGTPTDHARRRIYAAVTAFAVVALDEPLHV